MADIWEIMERMQGNIAAEIRVMLGEAQYPESLFTEEQRQRRIAALKQCALEATDDVTRHDAWMQMHRDGGWVYGETFDPEKKTHPNMLPWAQLPPSTRSKARIFSIVAKTALELEDAVK